MQFQDELAGGVVLVRPALQSPDYVPGVSGWAVKIDGSAEFNDITVRGTLESNNYVPGVSGWHLDQAGSAEFNDVTIRGGTSIGGEAYYYDGAPGLGTLLLSISANAGVDPFGNPVVGGFGVYDPDGSIVQLEAGAGASQYYTPQDLVGTSWNPALITTTLGSSQRGGLSFSSPSTTVNTAQAGFTMFGGGPTTNDTSILFGVDRVNFNGRVDVVGSLTSDNERHGLASTPAPGVGGGTSTVNVVFTDPMPATPRITISPVTTVDPNPTGGVAIIGYVDNVTVNGFTIRAYRSTNSSTNWAYNAHSD